MTIGPFQAGPVKVKQIYFDEKRMVLSLLPCLLVSYLVNKVFWLYRLSDGATAAVKAGSAAVHIGMAFQNPIPSLHPADLLAGIVGAAVFALARHLHDQDRKKFRAGIEYGSARWGTARDIAPYVDPNPENNIILTQTEGLTMAPYGREPKYSRNKNVLVIGGSGSGKTRFFVKPSAPSRAA